MEQVLVLEYKILMLEDGQRENGVRQLDRGLAVAELAYGTRYTIQGGI